MEWDEEKDAMKRLRTVREVNLMKTRLDIWEAQFSTKEEERMMKWKLNESGE